AFKQLTRDSKNTRAALVEDLRTLYLILVESARRKFGKQLEEQQEVMMKLSDLAIHLYAAESVLLRMVKQENKSELREALTDAALEDAVNQAILILRQLEQALLVDDTAVSKQLYESLMKHSFTKSIERNRHIASQ